MFAPTLNIPATLISLFVTAHHSIFGTPVDTSNVTTPRRRSSDLPSDAVRSPRKQMVSETLPTPAYPQTSFAEQQYQQALSQRNAYDTGFTPMQPIYAQPQQQAEGGFGSLNGALAPPVREGPQIHDMRGNGPTSKQAKRESSAFFTNVGLLGGTREGGSRRTQESEGMGGKF